MDSLFFFEDANVDDDYTDSPSINKLKLSKSWPNPLTTNKGNVKIEDLPNFKANSSNDKTSSKIVWISGDKKGDESTFMNNQLKRAKYVNRNTCTTNPTNKSDEFSNVKLVKGMIKDNRKHSSGTILGLINHLKNK